LPKEANFRELRKFGPLGVKEEELVDQRSQPPTNGWVLMEELNWETPASPNF